MLRAHLFLGIEVLIARAHPRLVSSVRAALMSLGQSAEGREVLRQINGTDGFVPATTDQYDFVRRAFRSVRSFCCWSRF